MRNSKYVVYIARKIPSSALFQYGAWFLSAGLLVCSLSGCSPAENTIDTTNDEILGLTQNEAPSLFNDKSYKKAPKYLKNKKLEQQSNYNITLNKRPSLLIADNSGSNSSGDNGLVKTRSGVRFQDVEKGDRLQPKRKGTLVYVHLTGWLPDGTKFVSTLDKGIPYKIRLGEGKIIKGLEEGIAGMQVGGTRTIVIPAQLAVGDCGNGSSAPAGKELTYKVILLSGGL